MRFAFCAMLCLALQAGAQEQADPAMELKQLEGTWTVASMEVAGKPVPADKGPKKLVIVGSKLMGLGPDMEIKIDTTKKPKWIDLIFKKEGKSYPVKAIYDLSGDEMRFCIPLAKGDSPFKNMRPKSFEAKDPPSAVLKLKRANP